MRSYQEVVNASETMCEVETIKDSLYMFHS